MAEIQEFFEDMGGNAKKLMKSKPFLIACGGVALVALYVNFNKKSTATAEDEVSYFDGSQAIGYAGYPGMVGSSGDSGQYDWYVSELEKIQEEYDENLEGIQSEYDEALAGFNKSLEDMQNEYDKSLADILAAKNTSSSSSSSKGSSVSSNSDLMDQWKKQQEYEADMAQMKANSDLWHVLGEGQEETKKALNQANREIAAKYGYTYNSSSGTYHNSSGSVVYMTDLQKAKTISGKTTAETSSTDVKYESNAEYQKKVTAAASK